MICVRRWTTCSPFTPQDAVQAANGGGHPTPRERAALQWLSGYVGAFESRLLGALPAAAGLRARAGKDGKQVGAGKAGTGCYCLV